MTPPIPEDKIEALKLELITALIFPAEAFSGITLNALCRLILDREAKLEESIRAEYAPYFSSRASVNPTKIIESLKSRLAIAETALKFYGNPETYHACTFLFDNPTGGFDKDFAMTDHPDYDRKMPGSMARKTLTQISEARK